MLTEDSEDQVKLLLIQQGIIEIDNDISEETFDYVRECISVLGANGYPDVEVHITSRGGSVDWALKIYDLLRLYEGEVIGKVFGYCCSAATVILQACNSRLCSEHSDIQIHNLVLNGFSLDTAINEKELQKCIREMKKIQKKVDKILVEKTGNTDEQIKKKSKKDTTMSAEEALKFGLIDEII